MPVGERRQPLQLFEIAFLLAPELGDRVARHELKTAARNEQSATPEVAGSSPVAPRSSKPRSDGSFVFQGAREDEREGTDELRDEKARPSGRLTRWSRPGRPGGARRSACARGGRSRPDSTGRPRGSGRRDRRVASPRTSCPGRSGRRLPAHRDHHVGGADELVGEWLGNSGCRVSRRPSAVRRRQPRDRPADLREGGEEPVVEREVCRRSGSKWTRHTPLASRGPPTDRPFARRKRNGAGDCSMILSRSTAHHTSREGRTMWKFARIAGLASLGGALAVILVAAAQGHRNGAAATPKRGGTLTFARAFEPVTFDPLKTNGDNGTLWTIVQIYDQLVEYQPGSFVPQPGLAQSWKISNGGKTITFQLRKASFSNGAPVTADDVVNCARRGSRARRPIPASPSSARASPPPRRRPPDTVVAEAQVPGPGDPAGARRADGLDLPEGGGEHARRRSRSAAAPFMLKSFTRGQSTVLVRNPHYWRAGRPYLDEVDLDYVPDDTTRVLQVRSGQADVAEAVPFSQIASLDKSSGVHVQHRPDRLLRRDLLQREVRAADRPEGAPGPELRARPEAHRHGRLRGQGAGRELDDRQDAVLEHVRPRLHASTSTRRSS